MSEQVANAMIAGVLFVFLIAVLIMGIYVIQYLEKQKQELRWALHNLLDNFDGEECRSDDHGNCQTHFVERNCSVEAARRVLRETRR